MNPLFNDAATSRKTLTIWGRSHNGKHSLEVLSKIRLEMREELRWQEIDVPTDGQRDGQTERMTRQTN